MKKKNWNALKEFLLIGPRRKTFPQHFLLSSLYIIGIALLYFVPNHLTLARSQYLPLTWLDKAIPLLVDSVWIYISLYPLLTVTVLQERKWQRLSAYLASLFNIQLLGALIFIIYPTRIPRPGVPDQGLSLSQALLELELKLDQPTNCLPSLHVASCLLSLALIKTSRPSWYRFFLIWFILVSISTLTVKQHYVVDVLAGLALGSLGIWQLNYAVKRYRI